MGKRRKGTHATPSGIRKTRRKGRLSRIKALCGSALIHQIVRDEKEDGKKEEKDSPRLQRLIARRARSSSQKCDESKDRGKGKKSLKAPTKPVNQTIDLCSDDDDDNGRCSSGGGKGDSNRCTSEPSGSGSENVDIIVDYCKAASDKQSDVVILDEKRQTSSSSKVSSSKKETVIDLSDDSDRQSKKSSDDVVIVGTFKSPRRSLTKSTRTSLKSSIPNLIPSLSSLNPSVPSLLPTLSIHRPTPMSSLFPALGNIGVKPVSSILPPLSSHRRRNSLRSWNMNINRGHASSSVKHAFKKRGWERYNRYGDHHRYNGVPSTSQIGENMFVNSPVKLPKKGLRPIIIDGSNVALGNVSGCQFSCKKLEICIKYFKERGHKVMAFVPQYRTLRGKSDNPDLLNKLVKSGDVILTPSKKVDGKIITSYDDRFIVQSAALNGGIIVTRDNYRDLLAENPAWAETIKFRTLAHTWIDDVLMFPSDPLGLHGPSLDEFLRFN